MVTGTFGLEGIVWGMVRFKERSSVLSNPLSSHSLAPTIHPSPRNYEAESPDEFALVKASFALGPGNR